MPNNKEQINQCCEGCQKGLREENGYHFDSGVKMFCTADRYKEQECCEDCKNSRVFPYCRNSSCFCHKEYESDFDKSLEYTVNSIINKIKNGNQWHKNFCKSSAKINIENGI